MRCNLRGRSCCIGSGVCGCKAVTGLLPDNHITKSSGIKNNSNFNGLDKSSLGSSVLFGLWIGLSLEGLLLLPAQSAYKAESRYRGKLKCGLRRVRHRERPSHLLRRPSRFELAQTRPARYIVTWSYHSTSLTRITPPTVL